MRWLLLIVLLATLIAGYNNCGGQNTRFTNVSGTVVIGNPLSPATNSLLMSICGTITRCSGQVTMSQCQSGVLNALGIGPAIGLTQSYGGSYSSIMQAEQSGAIAGTSLLTSCENDISQLSCSSAQVQSAYNPTNVSNPFGGVSSMIPAQGSCATAVIPVAVSAGITGKTYYVDSTAGSDSNTGLSPSAAWKTIAFVMTKLPALQPGDGVVFARGDVWNEQLDLNGVHGTAGSPVIFGNYGTGSLPVIDGGGVRGYCIDALNTDVTYVVIDGFECRNATKQGITFTANNTAMLGIVMQNNFVHNTGPGAYAGGSGPFDDGTYANQLQFADWKMRGNGARVMNNIVENCGGHNCLQVHGDLNGPVVQGNRVNGCVGSCINVKAVQNAVVSNNVVNCPSCGSGVAAYYIENTQAPFATVTFSGNVATNVDIGFQMESGGTCVSANGGNCYINAKYYNNTVFNTASFAFIDSSCRSIDSIDLRNNILGGGQLDIQAGCGSVIQDHNDCYNGTACTGTGDLSVDPQFVSSSAGNFHLQPASSCINAGQPGLTPGNNNIGAY